MLGFVPVLASLMLSASHDLAQRAPRCSRAVPSVFRDPSHVPPRPHLFRDPDVRDLAWAVFSPSLFSQDAVDILDGTETDQLLGVGDSCMQYLLALDTDPLPLRQWLDGRRRRLLGLKFESLVEFWLKNAPSELDMSSMRIHTQIHDMSSKTTIGEADFVIPDCAEESSFWHIETSIKYFLWVGGELGYIGPHRKETLDNRIEKANRQLKLLTGAHAEHAREVLNISSSSKALPVRPSGQEDRLQDCSSSNADGGVALEEITIRARYMSRGWLFYPFSPAILAGQYDAIPQDARVHAEHGRGWWAHSLPEWEGSEELLWTAAFRNADWPMAEQALAAVEAVRCLDLREEGPAAGAGLGQAEKETACSPEEAASLAALEEQAEGGAVERVEILSTAALGQTLALYFAEENRDGEVEDSKQSLGGMGSETRADDEATALRMMKSASGRRLAWRRGGAPPPVMVCALLCSECGKGCSCMCGVLSQLREQTRGFVVGPRWEPTQLKKENGGGTA